MERCSRPQCSNPKLPYHRYCRLCRNAYARSHRKPYREFSSQERLRARCRSKTTVAVQRGLLVRGPCAICGAEPVQAYHPDYAKPLEVVWLCRAHHRALRGRAQKPGKTLRDHLLTKRIAARNRELDQLIRALWEMQAAGDGGAVGR